MKAFFLDRYEKAGALRLGEAAEPALQGDDLLVEVHAAGLNVLDLKIRNGEFRPILKYQPPFILGHDVAGVVVRVGPDVRHFKPGDEIYARPRDGRVGAFAQVIAISETDAAHKPKTLTMVQAASTPLVGLTAWQALVERAKVQPGQKVFIQAGSGGVGTFAIQLAKHLGASVATTTSTANVELVKNLGADVVVDYKTQDFEKVLSGYDLVLHSLDSEALMKSLDVLAPGGKLISISGPPDPQFAKDLGLNAVQQQVLGLLSLEVRKKAKPRKVDYSFLFMRANGQQLGQIATLIEAGVIRPVVDRIFPFEALNEALAYLEGGRARGKVVVALK